MNNQENFRDYLNSLNLEFENPVSSIDDQDNDWIESDVGNRLEVTDESTLNFTAVCNKIRNLSCALEKSYTIDNSEEDEDDEWIKGY